MIAAAGLSIGASGCETETTSKPDEEQADPATSKSPEAETAGIGDAITLEGNTEGAQVKVRVIRVIDPVTGGQFDSASAGMRLVGVEMALVNTGSGTYDDSPSNGAQIITTRDEQADATLLTGGPCSGSFASSTKIAPGAKRRGCIPFEVPAKQKLKMFQFTLDSGFGPQTGEWSLR